MRTTWDRIRHALLFEGLAVLLLTALATPLLGQSATDMGALAILLSLIAMGWNYLYNLWFDRWQAQIPADARSLGLRLLHALGFEGGLLCISLPLIAWWLELSLWQALLADLGVALFFLLYALIYNWAYDRLFPLTSA